ncbi:DUF4391 domain-containing protein [Ferroacidibacillus organovorans]|uniref:DUF4391 domain-containing protein n=1 Tax=Ferroacidibacillus organovorans TaxID=1765683 RepID=A0A1V4ERX9_9BACL|nr:DUF4391 domain-containing protein [Ferroacidibacillus organovorans]OPG15388.1 hypothetical protein B2M26_12110 [Ferroacidibacillus organovorans]
MLGLPGTTEINKPLPKKALFDKFKPNAADRKLFDEQISRLSIVAEISPQTVSLAPSAEVSAIYVIDVTLKTPDCDKKNIALLSKLIDQRMLFVLEYGDNARLAVYRAEKVLVSEEKPTDEWQLDLSGLDLEAVWENIVAQIGSIDLAGGKGLDATIAKNDHREKLAKQIVVLEKKAMSERQPRRKWELAEEIKRLKAELEGMR